MTSDLTFMTPVDTKQEVKSRFVLVDHHGSASDRSVVEDVGVLELTGEEACDMNRKMVRSNCRMLPAHWFSR